VFARAPVVGSLRSPHHRLFTVAPPGQTLALDVCLRDGFGGADARVLALDVVYATVSA